MMQPYSDADHHAEFASEGLRTLVLGVKILSEDDTEQWLKDFKEASTSVEDRDTKLTDVAYEIEKDLHIVLVPFCMYKKEIG